MVYSNINNKVFYKESKDIFPEDVGYESIIYELSALQKSVLIVFGKVKHTFAQYNLVFYPIYLVNNSRKIVAQIGILEIPSSRLIEFLDGDNDLDIDKISEPLIYSFVDEAFLDRSGSDADEFVRKLDRPDTHSHQESNKKDEDIDGEDGEDGEDDSDEVTKVTTPLSKISPSTEKIRESLKEGIFDYDPEVKHPVTLTEETEEDAKKIKSEFKSSVRDLWIQKFMKNGFYDIHSVESNGDCLFAVVRDAFKQIGQKTTVAKLRSLVAAEATEKIFKDKYEFYLELTNSIRDYDTEMQSIKNTTEKTLKRRAKNAQDKPAELAEIMQRQEELKERYKKILLDKKSTEDLIEEGVGNFSGIDTLDKFREYIQTSKFWADDWAISVLEYVLQMKMIILSERSYLEGNLDGILNCGIAPTKTAGYNPKYYIMTTFSGNHYRLVTYKDKRILEYSEIPYAIKALIINKCLERNSGPFYLIEDFRDLKSRMGIDADEGKPRDPDHDKEMDSTKVPEFDKEIVFQFGITQPIVAKPGTASGEKITKDKKPKFMQLARFEEWRRKLDDDWIESPFTLHGHKWASVEHYYQGAKFKKQNPDFMLQFALPKESNENTSLSIATDVDLAKAAASKTGMATGKAKTKVKGKEVLLRPKTVLPDPDFEGGRDQLERIEAVRAKFEQNEDLKRMLLATQNAKLVRFIRRDESEPDYVLMNVRQELAQK